MENGCIFQPDNNSTKCKKHSIFCRGTESSKRKCPEWGQVVAFEEYLKQKLEFETGNGDC